MLPAFGHPAATCYQVLRYVARCWAKFQNGQMFHATSFGQVRATMLHPGMHAHLLNFQYPTCRNTSKQGGKTHAALCAQQCCDMLH